MISHERRCVFIHVPKTAGTSICLALGWIVDNEQTWGAQDHRTICEIQQQMTAADFGAYFKFAIVRNPWARVVSWFKNVREDALQAESLGLPRTVTFPQFVEALDTMWAMQSQLHWIRGADGQMPLDFVGRYERLREDFGHICDRLGVPRHHLRQRAGSDDRRPYTEFYDDATRSAVGCRYAEEIDLFGYDYGV